MSLRAFEQGIVFSANILSVADSFFYGCSAQNGGAIFSDIDKVQYIKSCTFVNCSAVERGGAIYIKQGDVTVKSCCSMYCTGKICPDIILWTPRNSDCSLLQCYMSESNDHLLFLSASKKLRVVYINSTNCKMVNNDNVFGGITIINSEEEYISRFVNIYKCTVPVVFALDYIEQQSLTTEYLNAISNYNSHFLLHVSLTESGQFNFHHSNFINNQVSDYFGSDSQNTYVSLKDCTFSFKETQKERVSLTNCVFGVSFNNQINTKLQCNLISMFSCKINNNRRNVSMFHFIVSFLFS